MTYLHQQEKALDKDGNKALTQEEANKVAATTKKKFPVFTSITPREVGGKWVYDWKGSSDTEKSNFNSEGGSSERPKELEGQSTPNLDNLQKKEDNSSVKATEKVSFRYVREWNEVYSGKQSLLIYVEGRAARKLGKIGEGDSIKKYLDERKRKNLSIPNLSKPTLKVYDNKALIGGANERIPDFFENGVVVGDVKDVKTISYSPQMKDNVAITEGYATFRKNNEQIKSGARFDLVVRAPKDNDAKGTDVSGPLWDAVESTGGRVYEVI